MPIYEYRCQSCKAVSEAFVRNGKEPSECPECGEESLQKLISRAGVIFKGSGFYVNDSKSASSSSSSNSGSSGGSESKAESSSSGTESKSPTESKSSSDTKSSADSSTKSSSKAE